MRFKDICEIWRLKERAADVAAQDAAHAEAQRTAAERALSDYEGRIGQEVQEAQILGTFAPVALWYPAAEGRLRNLRSGVARTAAEAARAHQSLKVARLEAERLDALRDQLRSARRRAEVRREQKELDEMALRRRR